MPSSTARFGRQALSELITEDTPEVRAELSACAAFLLPLAHACVRDGPWPMEVAAWLTMIRDSFAQSREGVQ